MFCWQQTHARLHSLPSLGSTTIAARQTQIKATIIFVSISRPMPTRKIPTVFCTNPSVLSSAPLWIELWMIWKADTVVLSTLIKSKLTWQEPLRAREVLSDKHTLAFTEPRRSAYIAAYGRSRLSFKREAFLPKTEQIPSLYHITGAKESASNYTKRPSACGPITNEPKWRETVQYI